MFRYLIAVLASGALAGAAPEDDPVVVIETNLGNMTVELYPSSSPRAVANFLQYAEDGFYEGTIFHRVRKGTLVQGGGFSPGLQQKKPREPIKNEAQNRVKNEKWTVSAARSGGIHTATAQFFINTNDNRDFDHRGMGVNKYGYTVFGKVIDGMDVVTTIENIKTNKRGGLSNVPMVPVIIKAVRLIDEASEPK